MLKTINSLRVKTIIVLLVLISSFTLAQQWNSIITTNISVSGAQYATGEQFQTLALPRFLSMQFLMIINYILLTILVILLSIINMMVVVGQKLKMFRKKKPAQIRLQVSEAQLKANRIPYY